MRRVRFAHALVLTSLVLLTLAAPGYPQRGNNSTNSPTPNMPNSAANDPRDKSEPDPAMKSIEQRQSRARNDERQKRLVSDTDKLLALATQLHEDVGKTDKNILSIEVVKRAEEIEKLARSVKERMKG